MALKIPIVFVPALFGTELVRRKKTRDELVYVTAAIGLNAKSPDISLPLRWDQKDGDPSSLPKQEMDDIAPASVMKKIQLSCFCNITLLDQYSTFCQHFEEKVDAPFYVFNYDWRRDLNESTDKLIEFLTEIKDRHGSSSQVISHSMGCLIALAALKTNPFIFNSVLFVGGNFGGGAGFYPTNTIGMNVGLNKEYLKGSVCHTFPSMYAAASPMGIGKDPILRDKNGDQLFQFLDSDSMRKGEKKVVDIDMYNLHDWKTYKLGPWSLSQDVSAEMEEHVKICLKLGKHFQERMRSTTTDLKMNLKCYPKIAVLVGDKHLKPDYFLWSSKKSCWLEWNKKRIRSFKPTKYVKTDGTVSYISASQPPLPYDGIVVKEYIARNNGVGIGSHRELMNDVQNIDKILTDLKNTK